MIPRTYDESLVRFLADPAHGGIYRMAVMPPECLVGTDGLSWHRLPVPPRWTRETLLDALAESLAFPAYFGRNWDAAWDCLTELGWEAGRAKVVLVPAAPTDSSAMTTFLELIADACDHWAARAHTLAVILIEPGSLANQGDDGEVPAWLAAVPRLPGAALGEV